MNPFCSIWWAELDGINHLWFINIISFKIKGTHFWQLIFSSAVFIRVNLRVFEFRKIDIFVEIRNFFKPPQVMQDPTFEILDSIAVCYPEFTSSYDKYLKYL